MRVLCFPARWWCCDGDADRFVYHVLQSVLPPYELSLPASFAGLRTRARIIF